MKVTGFQVLNYRSILDSGWVEIDDLTVLVGKNESGKTSLLRALHKFRPFHSEPYVIDREWPRGHRQSRDPNAVVCKVGILLNESEKLELRKAVDESTNLDDRFVVAKSYAGKFSIELLAERIPARPTKAEVYKHLKLLEALLAEHPPALTQHVLPCYQEVSRLAYEGHHEQLAGYEQQIRAMLLPLGCPDPDDATNQFVASFAAKTKELAGALMATRTMHAAATEFITKRLPTFVYMDDYKAFRGTARLDQVKQRKDQNTLTDEDKTLLTIMTLSNLDLESEFQKAQSEDTAVKEQRQYDLSDAGQSLTREIAERWKQRKYEVQFRGDGQAFFTMVKDETGQSLIPLEERSKGFQWFFSFDLMFMHESRGSFKGCVLLLDEPGLHLHANAQRDLVERLEAYAASNTLIYSTHLPFMLDLRKPDRIRTISETANGTVVDKTLNISQPDAKLTLQSALGMSGSSSYLVAQRNLVVEGVDDYMIISELSNLLVRSGSEGLSDDVHITAAGGASEAAYIATFMIGQALDVAVLLDSDRAGGDAADKLLKTWLTSYGKGTAQIVKVGDAIGVPDECAIEDLFSEKFYIDKVHEAYDKPLKLAGVDRLVLQGDGQLVKRVERAMANAGIGFNKGSVAKRIRTSITRMASFAELPTETQDRTKALLTAIKKALAQQ